MTSPTALRDEIAPYAAIPSYVSMLYGSYSSGKVYADTSMGGYYYAISKPYTKSTYAGAFANIQLPTVVTKGIRNGFVSLGINNNGTFNVGSGLKSIDLGLAYANNQWQAVYYNTTGVEDKTATQAFKDFVIPSGTTNVIIEVSPLTSTSVQMYIQPCVGTTPVGGYLKQTIYVGSGIVDGANICYYRFASLIPNNNVNNTNDKTSMRGGAFLNCQLYTPSASYACWGLKSSLMERAWRVSPQYITVTNTQYNDVFAIGHPLT